MKLMTSIGVDVLQFGHDATGAKFWRKGEAGSWVWLGGYNGCRNTKLHEYYQKLA
jgi:hypothetical protein